MSQRITETDVLSAFTSVKQAATSAGVKNVDTWTLHHGNSSYGYQWWIASRAGFKRGRDLGTTKREAFTALMHMAEAFWLCTDK